MEEDQKTLIVDMEINVFIFLVSKSPWNFLLDTYIAHS